MPSNPRRTADGHLGVTTPRPLRSGSRRGPMRPPATGCRRHSTGSPTSASSCPGRGPTVLLRTPRLTVYRALSGPRQTLLRSFSSASCACRSASSGGSFLPQAVVELVHETLVAASSTFQRLQKHVPDAGLVKPRCSPERPASLVLASPFQRSALPARSRAGPRAGSPRRRGSPALAPLTRPAQAGREHRVVVKRRRPLAESSPRWRCRSPAPP